MEMRAREYAIIVISLSLIFVCVIWGLIWKIMCLDYKQETLELRQENISLKWQLNEVDQMICIDEKESERK